MNEKQTGFNEFFTTDNGFYKRGYMKWRCIWYGIPSEKIENKVIK